MVCCRVIKRASHSNIIFFPFLFACCPAAGFPRVSEGLSLIEAIWDALYMEDVIQQQYFDWWYEATNDNTPGRHEVVFQVRETNQEKVIVLVFHALYCHRTPWIEYPAQLFYETSTIQPNDGCHWGGLSILLPYLNMRGENTIMVIS